MLHASRYDFKAESGERLTGCKVVLLAGEEEKGADGRGLKPMTVSLPIEAFNDMVAVPGLYEFRHSIRAGRDGKPQAVISGLQFLAPVVAADLLDGLPANGNGTGKP